MSIIDKFQGSVFTKDFFNLVCGDQLGRGHGREVWSCRYDPNIVFKFEEGGRSFQNVMEWQFWLANEKKKAVTKWLAPCINISPCGTVLIQARTKPINKLSEMPKRIPWWAFEDAKIENWSLYEDRPVMHDYAYTCSLDVSSRLEPVDWWVR